MRLCKLQRSLTPSNGFNCEEWNSAQVVEWLKGVVDIPLSTRDTFVDLNIDGKKLLNLESDDLKRIGISDEEVICSILRAIKLLIHYSYTIKQENLQKLALLTSVTVKELLYESAGFMSTTVTDANDAQHHAVNKILKIVGLLWENVAYLIFWLERKPFASNAKFVKLKDDLSNCLGKIVKYASTFGDATSPIDKMEQNFIEESKTVLEICKQIVFMDDPSVLYTAYIDRAVIRQTSCANWGFEIGQTSMGLNLITWVDCTATAVLSDKFDIGDEIIEIGGVPVVGWRHSKIVERIVAAFSSAKYPASELHLLLCKRPRDSGMLKNASRGPSRTRILLHANKQKSQRLRKRVTSDNRNSENEEDEQFKIPADESPAEIHHQFRHKFDDNSTLSSLADRLAFRRIRSSSFTATNNSSEIGTMSKKYDITSKSQRQQTATNRCVSLFMPSMDKKPIFRQSSVWNAPQKESNSAAASADVCDSVTIKTPQAKEQPESEVSIVVAEEMNNCGKAYTEAEEPFEWCESALSNIELVQESELEQLNIVVDIPASGGTEWNDPVHEITGLKATTRKRVHLDSGGVPLLDSPLSNIHAKIARFFHGGDQASPTGTTPPAIEVGLSTSKFVRSETQECKTPITPNSKISLELPLSAKTEGGSASFCSIDSPSAFSVSVMTCSTVSRRHHLAPLAEPDEIGDLSCIYTPTTSTVQQQKVRVHQKLSDCANISCAEQHHFDFAAWIRVAATKQQIMQKCWVECWALIKDGLLYIYENEKSERAEVVVNLALCSISRNSCAKSSKKHIFTIKTDGKTKIRFSAYSDKQLRSWMDHIIPLVVVNQQHRSDKSSDSSSSALTDASTSVIFSQKDSSIVSPSPSQPEDASSSQPFDSVRNLFNRVSLRGSLFKSKNPKN